MTNNTIAYKYGLFGGIGGTGCGDTGQGQNFMQHIAQHANRPNKLKSSIVAMRRDNNNDPLTPSKGAPNNVIGAVWSHRSPTIPSGHLKTETCEKY